MKLFLMAAALQWTVATAIGQNVGIGTTAPHPSAALELSSNTQGLLVPRLTKIQRSAIGSPATGLMVYQTGPDSSGFHYYNGSQWVWINPNMASGGTLPSSAIVLSETANNSALSAAGFSYNGLLRLPGATLEQTATAAANTWLGTNTAPAPSPASGHLALFNDSVFYVWGGNAGSPNPGTGLFKYNAATDRWTNMNISLNVAPAMGSTGVKVGNKWIHWGGYNYPGLSGPPAIVYDLVANTATLSSNAPFSTGLSGVAATTGNNKAYFFGGYWLTNFSILTNQGFVYNAQNNTWQTMSTTNAPVGRYYAGMVHTNSRIMVWGGYTSSGNTNTGGLYDTTTNTWTEVTTINAPTATIDPIMVWRSPYVYVISGNMAKRYDPASDAWTNLAPTPAFFSGNKFAYDGSGKIYIWGGTRVFFAPGPTANGYVYDIVANTFTALPLAGAPDARGDHTLTFGNNMLLAWGGTVNNSPSTPTAAQSLNSGGRFLLAPATVTSAAPAAVWHLFKKQ